MQERRLHQPLPDAQLLLAAAAAAGSSFDSSSSSLVWRPAKYCSRHLCPVSDSRPGSCAKYKQGSLSQAGSRIDPWKDIEGKVDKIE